MGFFFQAYQMFMEGGSNMGMEEEGMDTVDMGMEEASGTEAGMISTHLNIGNI